MKIHSDLTPLILYSSRLCYDIGQSLLVRRLTPFAKDFYAKTTESMSLRFHIYLLGKERNKVYIFSLGQMIKIASMRIYGKNLKNLPFPVHVPPGRWP